MKYRIECHNDDGDTFEFSFDKSPADGPQIETIEVDPNDAWRAIVHLLVSVDGVDVRTKLVMDFVNIITRITLLVYENNT